MDGFPIMIRTSPEATRITLAMTSLLAKAPLDFRPSLVNIQFPRTFHNR
jgi:hypothetical protein